VPSDIHAIVKDAHDQDLGVNGLIENDVRAILVTAQSGTQLLGGSAESGVSGARSV